MNERGRRRGRERRRKWMRVSQSYCTYRFCWEKEGGGRDGKRESEREMEKWRKELVRGRERR